MNDYIKPVDERLLYNKIVSLIRKSSTKKSNEKNRDTNSKNKKKYQLRVLEYSNEVQKLMMEMIARIYSKHQLLIKVMGKVYRTKIGNY
jgi:hypothetical protein